MPTSLREAFLAFALELQDNTCPNVEDLLSCDASSADVLIRAVELATREPPLPPSNERIAFGELAQHAHAMMARSSAQHSRGWRRIYTDACIVLAYFDILDYWKMKDTKLAISAIAHLDHAIVIAGAPGDGRLDLVLDLIEGIQSECLSSPTTLRRDLSSVSPQERAVRSIPQGLATAQCPVLRFDTPPSLASFVSRLSQQPFVLPGFLRDWPALNEHPWKSLDYLRAVAGPGRVVPVEVGSDYRSDDWTQKMMPWVDFLDSIGHASSEEHRPVLYLAQHSLFKQFPALRDDIVLPDYVYSSLDPPNNYPHYTPPGNEEQLVLNAWLGPGGTVSPPHTDPFYNFYAQVVGRKTIWLAPPELSSSMYPYSASLAHDAPPSTDEDQPRNPAANHESPSMSNTSRVDVFLSSTEDIVQSKGSFPDFWREVQPVAMQVTLEPGDLLFFPPGWWHAMRSEEMSFSVSMWF
ncbi:Clavaminate synthase-like protein [Cubamyces sp. BRFM 1775]|nr:Clavaminate synthase-like protein [Cubamyces sp. BRFM 1775]